jgi:hypothetical protein
MSSVISFDLSRRLDAKNDLPEVDIPINRKALPFISMALPCKTSLPL